MDYVDRYLRLEEKAADAEDRVEQYRQRADENRWEQCRIASEAVESGEFSLSSFAEAVGKSRREVTRQVSVWRQWALAPTRPAYGDAVAESMGTTVPAETQRKQIANAKAVLADPDLAREVIEANPTVRAVVGTAIQNFHRENPPPREPVESTDQKFLNFTKAQLDLRRDIGRLVEFANGARASGHVKPADLREIADEMRLYADALDAIAESRGLTDEALAEFIGEEA